MEHEAVNCVVEVDVLCCCHAVCGVFFCFMLNMYTLTATHSYYNYDNLLTLRFATCDCDDSFSSHRLSWRVSVATPPGPASPARSVCANMRECMMHLRAMRMRSPSAFCMVILTSLIDA